MQITLLPAAVEIRLATADYSAATIHKCFYWYTRDFNVAITPAPDATTQVRLTAKDPASTIAWEQLPARIHNDLVDFTLRELVAEETRTIRELLIAKAFAHYDTQQPPQSDVSDPVGFHPASHSQS